MHTDEEYFSLTLTEKVDPQRVKFLQAKYKENPEDLDNDSRTDSTKQGCSQYSQLTTFNKSYTKSKKFESRYETASHWKGFGRVYPNATAYKTKKVIGLSTFNRKVRAFLAEEKYVDVDIERAHWNLMRHLLKTNGLYHDKVDEVLDVYDNHVAEHPEEKDAYKSSMFSILYTEYNELSKDKRKQVDAIPPFQALHNYLYAVAVPKLEKEFPEIFKIVKSNQKKKGSAWNTLGCFLANILQHMERLVIMDVIELFQSEGFEIGAIIHDGFLVEKGSNDLEDMLEKAQYAVNQKYDGLCMKLVVKSFPQHPWADEFVAYVKDKDKDEKTSYATLCERLLEASNGMYQHDEENVYKQSETHPMVYNNIGLIEEFVGKFFKDDKLFNSASCFRDQMIKFCRTTYNDEFTHYKPDRNWLAFKNGVLNLQTLEFHALDECPPNVVARNYIDSALNREVLNTTKFEKLLRGQLPEEAVKYMYVAIARLFYKCGTDKLDVVPYVYGTRSSGKSTLRDIVSACFNRNQIGTINSNHEQTFGMGNLVKKEVIMPPDLPEHLSKCISQDIFKAMAGGECVEVPIKFSQAYMGAWEVPVFFVSNFYPDYPDTNGAISKRLMVFHFAKFIQNQNSNLAHEIIQEELPSIIYKALSMYHAETFTSTFESLRPQYFTDILDQMTSECDSMVQFLEQRDYYNSSYDTTTRILFHDDNSIFTPLEDVITRHGYFCKAKKIRNTYRRGDTTVFQKKGLNVGKIKLCKACFKKAQKGCCADYNIDRRTDKQVVFGLEFQVSAGKLIHSDTSLDEPPNDVPEIPEATD